jgi:hypothetical protein
VEPADLVVLHRVVRCHPDYARLLGAAADHARRALVFSYPPRSTLSRAFYRVFNLVMRLTHSSFRGYAHPPGAMVAVLEDRGLRRTYQGRSRSWQVAGLDVFRKARPRPLDRAWRVMGAGCDRRVPVRPPDHGLPDLAGHLPAARSDEWVEMVKFGRKQT